MTGSPARRRPVLGGLAWCVAVTLAAVAALRAAGFVRGPVSAAVVGTSPLVLLLSYPLAAAAAGMRRWRLLAVVAVVLVGQAVWSWPDLWRTSGASPQGTVHVRLVSANMLLDNPDVDGFARAIRQDRPDVLVLQEVTPRNLRRLAATGLLDALPHHVIDARPGFDGSAILSRLPLRSGATIRVAGRPMTRGDLVLPDGRLLRVVDVHAAAPVTAAQARVWTRQMTELGRLHAPGDRLVLAGDFNATTAHRPFGRLASGRLTDAVGAGGPGLHPTWPQRAYLPAVMRLDHVLTGRGLVAGQLATELSPGSDHRKLVVQLTIRGG